MSEIVEAIAEMTQVIADNPASILIVFGSIFVLLAVFIPIGMGTQVFLGGLGLLMLIAGIVVHVIWLQN